MKIIRIIPLSSVIVFLVTLTSPLFLKAQLGPNLAAGTGGLVYDQGQLDAQLILDIINTKTGEIKTEFGKRLILNKLKGGSYAFYSYAERNLNVLFHESNKMVITQEFMENSVELLLVYGMAEYILQDMQDKCDWYLDDVSRHLIEVLHSQAGNDNQLRLQEALNFDPKSENKSSSFFRLFNNDSTYYNQKSKSSLPQIQAPLICKPIKPDYSKYLLKPEITTYFTNEKRSYGEQRNSYYSGISMLADMIYDACLNNASVKSTGMFQTGTMNMERYKTLSKFWYFESANPKIFKALREFQPRVDSILTFLFSYYSMFREYKNLYDTDPVALKIQLNAITGIQTEEIDNLLLKLKKEAMYHKSLTSGLSLQNAYTDKANLISYIQDLPTYVVRIKEGSTGVDSAHYAKMYLDLAYSVERDVLPKLSALNMVSPGAYDQIIRLCEDIYSKSLQNASFIFKTQQEKVFALITTLRNYLPLLDVINNLDRVESYDLMFKFLTGMASTFNDRRTKAVVEAITSSVEKYTIISKKENKITIDVEGVALGLYNRFSRNQQARLSIFFTVGGSFNVSLKDFIFKGADNQTSTYSMFVSEKIGTKFNIFDWNRKRSFNDYRLQWPHKKQKATKIGTDPFVNNLHAIVYGSGILYKISALNSTSNFTDPIVGMGLGITFF